ncbi:hypothetical protein SAMN04488063_0030 [Halopelagius inordinatus]|uniref:Uncharacterized protein n=1 Tax=Halopelagius inordinatus TaxID=553467 RepID=A0A1I2WW51_9EURY|nr:hypothetical protein [Halopelagius inordinatus]SFH05523.1 hypothetical protein SAMN04488063_0030 [Halopelagius inordinatus]
MSESIPEDGKSGVSSRVPTNYLVALEYIAYERSKPFDRVSIDDLVEEAIREYLESRGCFKESEEIDYEVARQGGE